MASHHSRGAPSIGTKLTPPVSSWRLPLPKQRRATWKLPYAVTGRVVGVLFMAATNLFTSGLAMASENMGKTSHHHEQQFDATIEAGFEDVLVHRQPGAHPTAGFRSENGTRSGMGVGEGFVFSRRAGDNTDGELPPFGGFLELALERFMERHGRAATAEEEQWTFSHLQLVRVPKAASSEASVVARRLAGCTPRGPCCKYPGDPPGSCPARGLMCPKVTGCAAHSMGLSKIRKLRDPRVFSMANLRDVADRILSGFFYTPPHSPPCAKESNVDYESCFQEMIDSPRFQNVASKMLCGYYAYDAETRICSELTGSSSSSAACTKDLSDVLKGACQLNFVTICEAWGSSILLLFETLPWLGPTEEFLPVPQPHHGRNLIEEKVKEKPRFSRHNEKKEREKGAITPRMMELARRQNYADVELYEFVTARFCARLRDSGLLGEAVVQRELSHREELEERCNDASWVAATLERLEPFTPSECRLFEPLVPP